MAREAVRPGQGRVPERGGCLRRRGPRPGGKHEPVSALEKWLHRYTEFLATKGGLASALHSGDPSFDALPAYFIGRLGPAVGSLLDAAVEAGEIRAVASPKDLLYAVSKLCLPMGDEEPNHGRRMLDLLVDGLQHGAGPVNEDRPVRKQRS